MTKSRSNKSVLSITKRVSERHTINGISGIVDGDNFVLVERDQLVIFAFDSSIGSVEGSIRSEVFGGDGRWSRESRRRSGSSGGRGSEEVGEVELIGKGKFGGRREGGRSGDGGESRRDRDRRV